MASQDELDRLCRRFEIAVGNFGRSCMNLKANEKAFQAWYAACVIQEFGLSRVYREVHLAKDDLFELAGEHPLTRSLRKGNELFPDLSVSWQPDVDARHSSTRHEGCKHARDMLQQFGILSELKVTGSTGNPTSPLFVRQDLAKLGLFAAAHQAAVGGEGKGAFAAYMVVLDNFCSMQRSRPHYSRGRLDQLLVDLSSEWPTGVKKPTVVLLHPGDDGVAIDLYRDFQPKSGPLGAPPPIPTKPESRGSRKSIDRAAFLKRLAETTNSADARFMESVLKEAEARKLTVTWRAAGPALHYRHPSTTQSFSLGYFQHCGTCGFGWLDGQCDNVGLPEEIGTDYFAEITRLLGGNFDEGYDIAVLAAKSREWWAAVDRTVNRIEQGLSSLPVAAEEG